MQTLTYVWEKETWVCISQVGLHDGMLSTPVLKSLVWKFTSQPSRGGTRASVGLKHQAHSCPALTEITESWWCWNLRGEDKLFWAWPGVQGRHGLELAGSCLLWLTPLWCLENAIYVKVPGGHIKYHLCSVAWKIPWTEEPGRLQSMGSLRVWHDWETSLSLFIFMHWRRQWQPTPVFLPGES